MTDGEKDDTTSQEVANSTAQTTESQRDADPSNQVAETTAEMKSVDLSNPSSRERLAH
jgi:hypothetical protein